MENLQLESNQSQASSSVKSALDGFNAHKKIVFAVLNTINDAGITFIEGQDRFTVGNQQAKLQCQIQILDSNVYKTFVQEGSIGAAEAYMDGRWQSPDLTNVIQVFARSQKQLDEIESKIAWLAKIKNFFFHRNNANSEKGSKRNILAHYDLGNDLYSGFLDPEMMYSSAIYSDTADTLDKAQLNKLETICQRLELSSDDHLIEIGTGWGGMAIYAAQHYGCKVTTTTISEAQHDYAKARIAQLGLEDKITLLKQDYRKLTGTYDKLVSVEMIEAVGDKFLSGFFAKCDSLLKPGGKMLIQAITIADQRYDYYLNHVDFIQRYIFPGGCLPSISVMSNHIAKSTDMVIQGINDIGLDYARTLNDWRDKFNLIYPSLNQQKYNTEFKRLWEYYLCYCEGAFLEKVISTVHLTARKAN
ncbi:class I SAM-dependent methyltransferase [Catenovulum sp. SM1970]|uniref:SAM-dependent methyltransferase n=1 Tax=Marinifaba aquimaris TaxID=2741323 RepID=UPI00157259E4|nr:cyclopropane-fatty-acyl-phospholipid synthase family protein [Marinifaba aquimaris]NTS76468.1 class I SAM-dependent methyltransferase [Marinifaba aquimaris]